MKIISLCLVGLLTVTTLVGCAAQSEPAPDAAQPYAPCTAAPDALSICPTGTEAAFVCKDEPAPEETCVEVDPVKQIWCCP